MSPSEETLLECCDLSCGYAGRTVLHNVNLTLGRGKSIVMLGPNGSGKSTLLKTISKTIPALSGSVRVEQKSVGNQSFSDLARSLAYVPQEEIPPFRFTVRQVVMMGRMPLSTGFSDTALDHCEVERAMAEADCAALADRPITEISGGERQRALIARALAQEAPLLLLDEPTSHLDVGHQLAIVNLVKRLKEQGRAILVALHDLNLAIDLGDEAFLLHEGKTLAQAPTEEVLLSDHLDVTYGVRFERMRDAKGRLRVFAA